MKDQLNRYIMLKVNSEEWKIGDFLPSEQALAIKFNCNRHTVRNTLVPLRSKQIIRAINGKGNQVVNNLFTFFDSSRKVVSDRVDVMTVREFWNMNESSRFVEFLNKHGFDDASNVIIYYNLNKAVGIKFYKTKHWFSRHMDEIKPTINTFKEYSKVGIIIYRVIEEISFNKGGIFGGDEQVVQIRQELHDKHNLIEINFSFIIPDNYISYIDYQTDN